MRDILPGEKRTREELLAQIRALYTARGFQEIETPGLEDLERLTSGQGGDNEKLVFKVQKRGEELKRAIEEGGELADLGLRFDLTVPLTRFYATNRAKLTRVFKAIQMGNVWRAERPQKGRYRQFLQCDIDIIGDESPLAELELISASLAALDAIGLSSATIRLNDRRLLTQGLKSAGVTTNIEQAMITIDKLDKIGSSGVAEELGEQFGEGVAKAVLRWLEDSKSAELPELLAWAKDLGVYASRVRFDPSLVRGMGYYTGAIFEIEYPSVDASIGGGGRYDSMVGRWAGVDAPAVGISLGIERIIDLVDQPQKRAGSLVLLIEEDVAAALTKQQELIAQGLEVRLEPKAKNLKAQLAELSEQGYESFAFLVSGAELEIRPLD
jgi:histidyl-tRNA synthetase